MNKERLLKLADAIENKTDPKIGFQMENYITTVKANIRERHCETACCIAGFANALFDTSKYLQFQKLQAKRRDIIPYGNFGEIASFGKNASNILGLASEDSNMLFYPEDYCILPSGEDFLEYKDITRKDAAKVIRHLVATGKVDWAIIDDDN
jgi:hypothetical protein